MKKILTLLLLCVAALQAQFASNSSCMPCHSTIYEEYTTSMHAQATIFKDPIHAAVWAKHPVSKKEAGYGCAACHTPSSDDKHAMKTPNSTSAAQHEAISCAYCHRIERVEKGSPFDKNILSKDENSYFGAQGKTATSEHHKIDRTNDGFGMGESCLGCHTHRENSHGFDVCQTQVQNSAQSNCVSCHMPKVAGAPQANSAQKTHAFHGFAGLNRHEGMMKEYISLALNKKEQGFEIALTNHSTHALLLHPLRLGVVHVRVTRKGKTTALPEHTFKRTIGHEGKPTPPWLATQVIDDNLPQAKETRHISYEMILQSGDFVDVTLGYYLVNPKAAVSLGLENNALKILKETQFTIK